MVWFIITYSVASLYSPEILSWLPKGWAEVLGSGIFGWVGKFLGISGITESMTPQCKCFGWVEGLFFFHHFEMDNVFGLVQFVWLRRYYKCSVVIYWKKKSVGGKEGCVKSLGVAHVCYLFGQGNSIFIREFWIEFLWQPCHIQCPFFSNVKSLLLCSFKPFFAVKTVNRS